MKCIVLHESSRKMRIRMPQLRMSLDQADIVEYYLRNLDVVRDVHVYDRTMDVIITFAESVKKGKGTVIEALRTFDYNDEDIKALVPEETGRKMNREFEEKFVGKLCGRLFTKIFLPPVIREAVCIVKSIPYILKGIKCLVKSGLQVEVLDATAITASIIRCDYDTASSVMFLLTIGEMLEDWTRKSHYATLQSPCVLMWTRYGSGHRAETFRWI